MIIDSHCHIFPASFAPRHAELTALDATYATLFPKPGPKLATAEDLLADLQREGIDHAVVMGMGWCNQGLASEANDYLIAAVAQHPASLTGFCSVNPAWGVAAIKEMERCAQSGLRGVGELHPDTQEFDITSKELMEPLMAAAQDLGWPVVVHTSVPVGHIYPGKGHTTPEKAYRFIENFPENTIICAHWGGGLPFYSLMPEAPQVLKNVYYDSAASPFLYRAQVFEAVARLVGPEKILFGTDYPLIGHRRLIQQVQDSKLDGSAKEAILGGNAAKLLGL